MPSLIAKGEAIMSHGGPPQPYPVELAFTPHLAAILASQFKASNSTLSFSSVRVEDYLKNHFCPLLRKN